MTFLKVILLAVEVIVSLLMIGVILLQKSRSEGMGMAFGASMGESLFGSRAGNVLTRITIIFGVVFLVNTIALARLYSGTRGGGVTESLLAAEPEAPAALPATPGLPGPESGAAVSPGQTTLPDATAGSAEAPAQPAPAAAPAEGPAVPVAPSDESPETK